MESERGLVYQAHGKLASVLQFMNMLKSIQAHGSSDELLYDYISVFKPFCPCLADLTM